MESVGAVLATSEGFKSYRIRPGGSLNLARALIARVGRYKPLPSREDVTIIGSDHAWAA